MTGGVWVGQAKISAADITTQALTFRATQSVDPETLTGLAGFHNVFYGGAGVDILKGEDSSSGTNPGNSYYCSADGDTCIGTLGNDQFFAGPGNGATLLKPGGGTDILTLSTTSSEYTAAREGNDVVLAAQAGDVVRVQNWYLGASNQLAEIRFAEGTSWTPAMLSNLPIYLAGTLNNDTLTGPQTNVRYFLSGREGADTLQGGNLADVLDGGSGNDTLRGGAGSDVFRGGDGNDMLGGADSADRGYSSAGPTYWAAAGASVKFVGNDYTGGTGNDTLLGTYGADTYHFNLGDGTDSLYEAGLNYTNSNGRQDCGDDVLLLGVGINTETLSVSRNGTDLILATGYDSIAVKGWYQEVGHTGYQLSSVQFADGVTWSNAELTAKGLTLRGTEGNDTLYSVANWSNTLLGNGGSDILEGNNLTDVLDGGAGNDTLRGGAGSDVFRGGDGNDTLGGGDSADRGYSSAGPTYWVAAGASVKFVGNDYTGGTGNDTLLGTFGADTYHFNLGDGTDSLYEAGLNYTNSNGRQDCGDDVLLLGDGITAATLAISRIGTDLILGVGSDSVAVKGWYQEAGHTGYQLATAQFADGTMLNNTELTARGLHVEGTSGNDTLTGLSAWANELMGNDGNGILNGGALADYLAGGTGNNTLNGGLGDDLYVATLHGGSSTVTDTGGLETLILADVLTTDVSVSTSGNNLAITLEGSSAPANTVTLIGQALAGSQIGQFQFLDGMRTAAEMNAWALSQG